MLEESNLIGEGQNSLIYLYRGDQYPNPVILKVLKEDHNFYPYTAELSNEYELTKNLGISGVRSAIALSEVDSRQVLVMNYFEGKTLKQFIKANHISFPDKLRIAMEICEILVKVHDKDIIHRDLSANNILINPTNKPSLIDFGLASNFDMKLDLPGTSEQGFAGTLPYISPEQTGRVNHVVDHRSDLYSLGVVLYELFTGRVPFETKDPMELVHAHLAVKPSPLTDISKGIPEVVSRIVLKLLAKDVESRYQSVQGLLADLEQCHEQLDMRVAIRNFSLGEQDQSGRFLIPSRLYGREKEIEVLISSFEQLGNGQREITLISGSSGTGKTSLVYEIHKPVTRKKGIFLSGKHEQLQKGKPYLAIAQAFQGFFNLILSENEETLKYWKKRMLRSLGNEGRLLTDLIPNLELIIGEQPKPDSLGMKEAQNRFKYVFLKFIASLASKDHPMVLFIDDLQWADAATLDLLNSIILHEELKYFYFIGSYRDNEIDDSHPLNDLLEKITEKGVTAHHIRLPELSREDAHSLIKDTFSISDHKADELTEVTYAKTAGNPFFLSQFLRSIHENGYIVYDQSDKEWKWDITLLQSMNFTDNVVELMIEKIKTLDPIVQKTLQLASCIGDRFDLRTLIHISQYSAADMKVNIWAAVKEQMVIVRKNNPDYAFLEGRKPEDPEQYITYQFAHDRIRQAAYELIPEEEKSRLHRQIGELLLRETPPAMQDDLIFEIVYQLNKGGGHPGDTEKSHELIRLNYRAGKKAKESTAFQTALTYYSTALSLAGDAFKGRYPEVYFRIHLDSMECCYLNGDYEEMHRIGEILLSDNPSLLEEIQVKNVIIHSYIAQSRYVELLELAVSILKKAGIRIPSKANDSHILLGFAKTKLLLRNKADHYFENLPRMSDDVIRIAVNMMTSVSTASYHNFPKLFPVVIFKSLQLALKYGNSLDIMAFYGGYGSILCGVTGDYQRGYDYGKLSLRLIDKYEDTKSIRPKAYVIFGCFISHWKEHLSRSVDYLKQAHIISMETGDRQYAVSGLFIEVYTLFWLGKNLTKLLPKIALHAKKITELKQESQISWIRIFHQVSRKIAGTENSAERLSGEVFDVDQYFTEQENRSHQDRTAKFHINFHQAYLLFLNGRYHEALDYSDKAQKDLEVVLSTIYVPLFYFYDALIRLQLASSEGNRQKKLLRKVRVALSKFRKWSGHSPTNFQHKYDLLSACYEYLKGNHMEAETLFRKSAEGADSNGYFNELALCCELHATIHERNGNRTEQVKSIKKAHSAYKQWGAHMKVKQLETTHQFLVVQSDVLGHTSEFRSITSHSAGNKLLDLGTIMKASATIASEIRLERVVSRLLKIVIENAGAQNGVLLLHSGGEMVPYARAGIDSEVQFLSDSHLSEEKVVPYSIIQYVKRTGEKVVIEEATSSDQFGEDTFVKDKQVKSVLCLPVLHHGELMCIIYLENSLIRGAFTLPRTDLITLLSGQIAVSLNNALLYENLEEKVQERTRQIEEQNTTLKDLNAEKDYLISMVSHDLRSPLNGIKAFARLASKKIDHEKITDFTQPIEDSIDRLDAMITRILDISAINAKELKMNPTHFSLSELIVEIIASFQVLADKKDLTIRFEQEDIKFPVFLDREALTQVINNLISNAIKFSEENKTIEIVLSSEGDETLMEVKDQGPGISQKEQKLLFNQFRKLTPSATGGEKSTGLGLAIVKKYVESMDGRVWCESEPGDGASFFIAFKSSGD